MAARSEHTPLGLFHTVGRVIPERRVLAQEGVAERFLALLRLAKQRFGLRVYAWCVLHDSYHLVACSSRQLLASGAAFVHRELAKWVNRRHRRRGSLWQRRLLVCAVRRRDHVQMLIPYVHLRPVVHGRVADPADYPWCGHGELVGHSRAPLVDRDGALALFGRSRQEARQNYLSVLHAGGVPWCRGAVWRLPWWRSGRHAPSTDGARRQGRGPRTPQELRRWIAAMEGVDEEALVSRRKSQRLTQAREALLLLGFCQLDMQLQELAPLVGLSYGAASRAMGRARDRLEGDAEFSRKIRRFQHLLVPPSSAATPAGPGIPKALPDAWSGSEWSRPGGLEGEAPLLFLDPMPVTPRQRPGGNANRPAAPSGPRR